MSNDEIITIDHKFIEENKKLGKTMQNSQNKKGGPYTKSERQKRREEVYRLHFELGEPATKIAEYLNVNKNTINSDIHALYEQLGREYFKTSYSGYMQKQFNRLELQRSRLIEYLKKCDDIDVKLSVERLIFDIDQRLTHTIVNSMSRDMTVLHLAAYKINTFANKKKWDLRYYSPLELIEVTKQQRDDIDKILDKIK